MVMFGKTRLNFQLHPSVSKNSPEKILVSSNRKTISQPTAQLANDNIDVNTCHNCELLKSEYSQLAHALEKNTQLTTAEHLLTKSEIKYTILKDKHESEIINALHKCKNFCNLVFDSDGILVRIEPDTIQVSNEET